MPPAAKALQHEAASENHEHLSSHSQGAGHWEEVVWLAVVCEKVQVYQAQPCLQVSPERSAELFLVPGGSEVEGRIWRWRCPTLDHQSRPQKTSPHHDPVPQAFPQRTSGRMP